MKYILISGAAKRLGANVALHLAKTGHDIIIHYRSSKNEAEELASSIIGLGRSAKTIQGDFSTREGVQDFIDLCPLSEIKSYIHNVGNFQTGELSQTKDSVYYDLFQTNLHAAFEISRALVPSLKNQKGSLVYMGIAGIETRMADIYASAYQMAKTALWVMMRSFAKELKDDGVSVNMVSPGYLEGSIVQPKEKRKIVPYEDVSKIIAFLMESASITGQNIEVAKGVRL